jgi:transposase
VVSIKGIGIITAAIVVGETNGFSTIKNKRQLVSYTGYDIVRKDSGTSVHSKPRISKKGNRHIRKAMHFPALSSIRSDEKTKNTFIRIVQKHGIKMKAAVAIQRKLLVLMYTLWKKEEYFNPDYNMELNKEIGQLALP